MKSLVPLLILCSLIVAGCSKNYTGDLRYALEGKVTVNDEPLDGAMILFLPNGEGGRAAGGPIIAGKYAVPVGQGATKGSYRVEVRWLKPTGKQRPDEDTGGMVDIVKEALPARYNDKTELKAEVGSGKNTFDFELIATP